MGAVSVEIVGPFKVHAVVVVHGFEVPYATAHGHPEPDDGYPDPDRHLPWNECRTLVSYFDGARRHVDGAPLELELYAAAVFRFGTLRTAALPGETRIILEAAPTRRIWSDHPLRNRNVKPQPEQYTVNSGGCAALLET